MKYLPLKLSKTNIKKNRKPFYADIKEKIDYMQTNLLNTQLLLAPNIELCT